MPFVRSVGVLMTTRKSIDTTRNKVGCKTFSSDLPLGWCLQLIRCTCRKTIVFRINPSNLLIMGLYMLDCQDYKLLNYLEFFPQVDLTRVVRISRTNFSYRSQMESVSRQESINGKNRFRLVFWYQRQEKISNQVGYDGRFHSLQSRGELRFSTAARRCLGKSD